MLFFSLLLTSIIATTSVTITEPLDGETYNGDWLTLRAIVENDNEIPDSVHYSLNGDPIALIPRLNTDWPTYMQNYLNHGFSESPAPLDNSILWTAAICGEIHEFPTPVVVDGILYYPPDGMGYEGDSLHALDAVSGEVLWAVRTGYTDDAVTVVNGRLYTASDSIFCFDALTGDLIWKNGLADWSGSTPIVVDNKVYAAKSFSNPARSHLLCFDAEDGNVIWCDTLSGKTVSCLGYDDGILYMPTYEGGIFSPMWAINALNGSIVWLNNTSYEGYWDSSPLIVDEAIYINGDDGFSRAFNIETGECIWEVSISSQFITPTSSYHDGKLYFSNEVDGNFSCLSAFDGSVIWSDQDYYQHGSSAIADGIVFFGESENPSDSCRVFALDCDTGEEIWHYQTGGYFIGGSPSVVDGIVYIASTDHTLYAFGSELRFTYLIDLYAQVGANELIATSFAGEVAVAADTISFNVTGTGIDLKPSQLLALSASPNPFVSSAFISFELSVPGRTSIQIFDLFGRSVTTLLDSELVQGEHSISWDGCRQSGKEASAGLYLCRIHSGGVTETTGLCLLR